MPVLRGSADQRKKTLVRKRESNPILISGGGWEIICAATDIGDAVESLAYFVANKRVKASIDKKEKR